jgi:alanyl-tRNA synthetase
MTSQKIRQEFLDFFASKGHAFVPSSPVVPHDDPTLMFTNAGMNQFKPIFLGAARPDHPRVANSQKCIRAGGKHNDLDDVGQDTYHHTFFEMLGNWSFGDYFKKEAIEWAWELLTKVWGIDKSRLHATYFGGQQATKPRSDEATEGEGTEERRDEGTPPQLPPLQRGGLRGGEWELEPDYEARDLWLSVTDIDPSHVHPGSMKDNFWEMGETGPCGPCSEIHIDLTPDKSGRELVNKGDARVIELWNLVFIQFNRASDGKLTPLPAKHVDTGMGFERLCAVLQGMDGRRHGGTLPRQAPVRRHEAGIGTVSNYDTDVFAPIFGAIQKRTAAPPYCGTLPDQSRDREGADGGSHEATKPRSHGGNRHEGTLPGQAPARKHEGGQSTIDHRPSTILVDVSYRVIADHLRCLVFALTDGAIPSNEGRGYVLRRILRRAVRYGRQYLNMHEPFLCDLVPTVVEHMKGIFPELRSAHGGKNVQHVTELIRDEEASFIRTLDRGIKLFEEAAEYARGHHHGKISGEDAFRLHDTYGFPIDLTELMAEEQGLTIDIGEYERLMAQARDFARGTKRDLNDAFEPATYEILGKGSTTCDDSLKYIEPFECTAFIWTLGARQLSAGDSDAVKKGERVRLQANRTPFYAEQGGQVGDVGSVETATGEVRVTKVARGDATVDGQLIVSVIHHGEVIRGEVMSGQEGRMRVDLSHRVPTMQNHTSTHILNWALREVLGEHVQQKGSLVDPEKTRFDFSHNKQLSEDELAKIEQHVQSQVSNALPVLTNPEVDQKKAREINTLRAVFGEKYPDKVRVVSIGADIDAMLRDPTNPKWMQYSVEFCGGTHLKNSKEAEEFVLVHEEAVAKGVRRLVGLTGERAKEARRRGEFFLEVSGKLRTEVQSSKFKVQKSAGPPSGPYDLTRLLRELSEATIPLLTRHRLAEQIAVLQESAKEHEKKAAATAQRGAVEAVGDLLAAHAIDVNGVTIVVGEVPGGNADALRSGIDYVRNKRGSSAVLLATVENGKVTLVAGMSRDVVDRGVKAGDLIKEICPLVGGRGGGRPDMAQGGGSDPKGLPKALDRAREWLGEKLS